MNFIQEQIPENFKMDNYIKTIINRMAKRTNTTIAERHLEILEYAYEYYKKNKVGPLYTNLKKNTGAEKKEIDELFPYGLFSIYSWTGIPIHSADNPCKPPIEINIDQYREVYLDYNATTYIRPEVSDILIQYCKGNLGYANPSSNTLQGKRAFDYIHTSRNILAKALSVEPQEIFFTGSGSEACNMAIKGIAFKNKKGHIITSKIEHNAVLKTVEYLETTGFSATYLDVNKDGLIETESVKKAIRNDTILVSIMAVNNEIGTINPVKEIGEICNNNKIPFFVDAVQAFCKIPMDPVENGISLMAMSAHKIYAPKGIGALYVQSEFQDLIPLIHGGGQENELRSGTENVGHIIAFGKAVTAAYHEMESERKRLTELRNYFLTELKKIEPGFIINGSMEKRIPNNLSIGFPDIDSGALLLNLNSIGICVSVGSACSAGKFETSHVIAALKTDTEKYSTIRFSFGLKTTKEDLDYMFKYLPEILRELKQQNHI